MLLFAGTAHAAVVTFPDPNLEAAVRASLSIPTGDILDTDMQTLTYFGAASAGITSLVGLEYATNLTYIDLYFNSISDVSPLSGLTSLTELRLGTNQISDVSPLSGLTSLTHLFVGDNQISDVSPLSGLTSLTELGLDYNSISDLSPLSGLTSLTDLALGDNQISDVSPLSGLTSLFFLTLSYNQISDISSLVANSGLDSGDYVFLNVNPLDSTAYSTHIPALEARGVTVYYDESGEESTISVSPTGLIVEGDLVELTAPAGSGYQWKKYGLDVADEPPRVTGATSQVLRFDTVLQSDSGSYTVVYNNGAKAVIESPPINLAVYLPEDLPAAVAGVYALRNRRRA